MLKDIKTKIFRKRNFAVIFLLGIAGAGALFFKTRPTTPTTLPLAQEELVRLVKPSVVRIVQHVTGSYSLPEFEIDLPNLNIAITGNTETEQLDEYITGSGFVVQSDGYIVTNAHVVSKESIKSVLLEEALAERFDEALQNLDAAEQKKLQEDEEAVTQFGKDALRQLIAGSRFDMHTELVVLNPASDKENIKDLLRLGFPAEIISVNDEFAYDEKDVALIKINQRNLPVAQLSPQDEMPTGSSIYVFGFPATAEFNRRNPVESTFTEGIVSASKFSDAKDFKVYQTNAKISRGSSGGPMFNNEGQIIGIITFQTGEWARQAGDSFAFAIPIRLARQTLANNKVQNETGEYASHFQQGLQLYKQGRCRRAIAEFELARNVNFYFVPEKQINPLIKECEERIRSGSSIDSPWQQWTAWLKGIGPFVWFVIIGRILLVAVLLYALFYAYRRVKKDEREIEEMKADLEEKKQGPSVPAGPPLPLPDEEIHAAERQELNVPHPHLASYVKEARDFGLPDDHIHANLKNAGWPEHEIRRATE